MMNNTQEYLKVLGGTIFLFVSGLFTGIWIQQHQPDRFAPPLPLREFGPGGGYRDHEGWSPEKIKEMEARMEQLRPQMEDFNRAVTSLQEGYRVKINEVLTPDQQKKWPEIREHMGGGPRPENGPPPGPPGNPPVNNPHQMKEGSMHGMATFIGLVVYKPQLEVLTRKLELTPAQHDQIEQLLVERRQDLLKLVDQTPPPSLHAFVR